MLYHLFKYFDNVHNLPGAGMFQYISFRAAAAIIIALLIVIVFGRNIINFLRRKQIGEEIRDLGLEGQLQKKGTPTMGGVIILLAILIPVLLFGQLDNVYIQLMLVSTIWLGLIGFLDDYIKVFRHHKEGLKGRFKIVGQVGLGIIVGTTMCFSPDIVVREKTTEPVETIYLDEHGRTIADHIQRRIVGSESRQTTQTTIPFVKDNEFDYRLAHGRQPHPHLDSLRRRGDPGGHGRFERRQPHGRTRRPGDGGIGPDRTGAGHPGLSLRTHRLCRLPEHHVHSGQRRTGRLRSGAGRCAGRLPLVQQASRHRSSWAIPARSPSAASSPSSLSASARSLLLPLLCGIFLVESLSVMLQVSYFKYTKRKYGEGRRILLMSPLHHHYQKQGFFETKIVTRFWIVSLLLAAITLVTLKIR